MKGCRCHRKALLRVFGPWFVALGLWLDAPPAEAQINIEGLMDSIKEHGWESAAKAGLSKYKGNINLFEITGEAATRFATAQPKAKDHQNFLFRDRVLLYGTATYKRVSGARVINNGYAHLRYTRMQWIHFGMEIYGQAQFDKIRLLQRRLIAGAGLRAVFLDTERFGGWLGSGYMYEYERRHIQPQNRPPMGPDPVEMANHRWNNYITMIGKALDGKVTAVNTVYVQPCFDDFSDIQILETLSLAVSITDILSVTSDLLVRYDSRAPRTIKRTDVQLTQGLALTF